MAGELKLNNVSVATESGGVVSLSAANTLAFPTGHIVQMQTAVSTTTLNIGSGTSDATWVDTNLSVNITPKFNNSKIYLHHVVATLLNNSSSFGMRFNRTVPTATSLNPSYTYHIGAFWIPGHSSLMSFDTPSTTSQCTYMVQVYKTQNGIYWNYSGPGGDFEAQLIAMEIKQ